MKIFGTTGTTLRTIAALGIAVSALGGEAPTGSASEKKVGGVGQDINSGELFALDGEGSPLCEITNPPITSAGDETVGVVYHRLKPGVLDVPWFWSVKGEGGSRTSGSIHRGNYSGRGVEACR